jgi:large subunit ribosomal protein L6
MPVALPTGVDVALDPGVFTVKGPKGSLSVPFDRGRLDVQVAERSVRVERHSEEKAVKALHGLIRSLIANAVAGVTQGFARNLDVYGVGFRAEVQGRQLTLYIGYSHPVVYQAPEGIELALEAAVSGAQARIVVRGIDKQKVGQVAAEIRHHRKPDPYKGKGIRYEDEVIHWKAGKTAVG